MRYMSRTYLIQERYREIFGASITPAFAAYINHPAQDEASATLGYRRASHAGLFLERYLDRPVEQKLSEIFGLPVERSQIVEIGNLAAETALGMIELWGAAANDLAGESEIAVATLTAPLRRILGRIGVPLLTIAQAKPECLGHAAQDWGRYYEFDPHVCAGMIADGQSAINAFMARRNRRSVA